MLEQEFNVDALHILREAVLACAMAAGMPESRATDVVLAAHELAANAVRYGGGRGRLCIWIAAEALHCQVTRVFRASAGTARLARRARARR